MKIQGSSNQKSKDALITIDKFNGGSNKLLDEAHMPSQYAVESVNQIQVQDGLWKTKWGSAYYGADCGATPDGASEYVKADGTTELITIVGGKAYKSTDGGALTEITGATFTAGLPCFFLQIGGYDTTNTYYNYLYIANGTDALARYNGTVLTKYTALAAPAGLSASLAASGLASGTYVYYAEVTALNDVGETTGSTEASLTCNKKRDSWVATTDKMVWSWSAVAGANRYQLYLANESGDEELLTSATTTSFSDDGTTELNPYIIPPELNTTGAPKFTSMCVSGNRIWATNDANDKYKVYFSGTAKQIGNFSDFYGGGWINLEKGGREMPVAVKHYQSGQGTGVATVLCKTPDGRGAIWQITIDSATVGDTSFSIPSAQKVVGSFGTESLLGVTQDGNNIAFPNRKGWFSLGTEKNYYGILRTNERSSIIRNYWRSLIGNKISSICSYFYDSKFFISVPTSTAGNDKTIIYDTERGNWSVDWTNGAKQFLEYTDTGGTTHFLYIPLSGNKLIELSENYLNDCGTAFYQSYISPIIPVSKDFTDIMTTKQFIVELARPQGSVNFSILGIGAKSSISTLGTATITDFGASTGVGSDFWSDEYATSTQSSTSQVAGDWTIAYTSTPSTFAQATTKKAIRKRAKIYGMQFKVNSSTADTQYTILSLQAKGRLTPKRLPSSWTI